MGTHSKSYHRRLSALAKVHIGKKQLGLNDDVYRAMLLTIGRVKSSADLTKDGLDRVIRHMEKSGAVFVSKKNGRTPNNIKSSSDRSSQMEKIGALLAESERPWEYAQSIGFQMFKKQRLEFCTPNELSGIIAALMVDAKRHGRQTGGNDAA